MARVLCDLFRYESLEINSDNKDETLIFTIEGKTYLLSELGSGIAQFLMVLGNAAMKKPDFILIDEPELNLHPSLQRDFLTALGLYANNGVIFSTHILGLAHCDADIVYSVQRLRKAKV